MKQSYTKPVVTRVELKAQEALMVACKTGAMIGTGWDVVAGPCIPVASACRDGSGS